jgi:N-acetylglucosamine-6-phosphate deacetylase
VIESAYLLDNMFVEIIADGKHLPAELIRLILKLKGTDHTILCTDSLAIAGTDVKEGITMGTEFVIEDGVCKLKDRSAFAGSIATSDTLVRTLVHEVGISVPETIKMMTKVPAKLLGINKGTLESGMDADIVIFDDDIRIRDVFVIGKHL